MELMRLEAPPVAVVPNIDQPVTLPSGGAAFSVSHWDNATFADVAAEIFNFQGNAGGRNLEQEYNRLHGIQFQDFTTCIIEAKQAFVSRERLGLPHIALARVVVMDAPPGNIVAYPIPYVFFSKEQVQTGLGFLYRNRDLIPHLPLDILTNRQNKELFKSIFSYGYTTEERREQSFAHSERVVGLCLNSTADHFRLSNIVADYNAVHVAATAVIQIKTALASCSYCEDFWSDDAGVEGVSFCESRDLVYDIRASLSRSSHLDTTHLYLRVQTEIRGW
jgi:hypothetical protein